MYSPASFLSTSPIQISSPDHRRNSRTAMRCCAAVCFVMSPACWSTRRGPEPRGRQRRRDFIVGICDRRNGQFARQQSRAAHVRLWVISRHVQRKRPRMHALIFQGGACGGTPVELRLGSRYSVGACRVAVFPDIAPNRCPVSPEAIRTNITAMSST